MTDSETIVALIGATLLATIIGMAVKSTRAITRSETEMRTDFDAQIDNLQRDISKIDRSASDRNDKMSREFGETVAAVRQKINDVELNSERFFVAKGDFDDFRKEYREDMRDLKSSIAGLKQ